MYSFEGVSRRVYFYGVIDPAKVMALAWPAPAGNFLLVRKTDDGLDIIHAGDSENVWETLTATDVWSEAQRLHGANFIYGHPSPDAMARDEGKRDLVVKWQPPMNVPSATH